QASNASFDALTFEVWGALLSGARLSGVSTDVVLSPVRYARWISEAGVTALFLTTALFNEVARSAPWAFTGVEAVLFGGQAADAVCVRLMVEERERSGWPKRLLHVYGPTESTTFATWQEVEEVRAEARSVAIGRAIGNTRVYVMDGVGRMVGVGVVGELYIRGEGLAQGYVGRAEQTAERFVPDAVSGLWEEAGESGGEAGEAGGRLYRTGDLVRWNGKGELEYVGRMDDQVKVRGYRIEPGEIAAALREHEAVKHAVVVAVEDERGEGKRLVGYVVWGGEEGKGGRELREYMKERLPEYMVPSVIAVLDELPLNENGKVDRRRLPAPESVVGEGNSLTHGPATPVQQALYEIWSDVLKVGRIGVEDSFFDLGGHSLMATQIVSRINQVFQVGLPVRSLFETPTIAELSAVIEGLWAEGRGASAPEIRPVARDRELPLSFPQQRFWFMDRLVRGSATHHVPAGVGFDGRLSVAALAQSFSEIVRRHEVLRTNIRLGREQAVQVVQPHEHLSLPVVDLSGLSAEARAAVALRLTAEHLKRPFDLSNGSLLRLALLRSGAERNELLLTSHHIITDAWSTGLLVRELVALYESYLKGAPSPLLELTIQYADFAVWQREWLQGEMLAEQLAYWDAQLADVPPTLEVTGDRARASGRTASYANQSFFVPRALREGLATLGRREGVTTFMMLLAAYQVLLYRYTGRERVCVGSPVANRHRAETEHLIGCFINMLALCTDLGGNPSFREVLRRVREVTLGAYDHQDLPFDMLVGRLQPERSLGQSPIIQTTISFQNTPAHELKLPGLSLRPIPVDAGAAEYELLVIVNGGTDELGGVFVYNEEVFGAAEIEQLWSHLKMILEQAVARPECLILDLELDGEKPGRLASSLTGTPRNVAAEQFNF
ncbi:MAG: condensation domain-containing protein, partial [Pyrinomonadaceae bacterium]